MLTPESWSAICGKVCDEMAVHVHRFVTPISLSFGAGRGQALGTGAYLALGQVPYLLTNEHVVTEGEYGELAHLPGPTDDYIRCPSGRKTEGWPIDLALVRLDCPPSVASRGQISAEMLDSSFAPAECELLFWLGFPGSTAKRHEPLTEANTRYSWFGYLETPGIPMLTQQFPFPTEDLPYFDPLRHTALHYPSEASRTSGKPLAPLPNAKGMSGSLLWDTKFVACTTAGEDWSADKGRVCGVIWAAHPDPEVVIATKIEYVRETLLRFLREQYAYERWMERGRPLWEAMVDWTSAEQAIPDIGC